jgi:hypothetical protein
MNCPECRNESRTVWMLHTSFQYCDTCKEDLAVIETRVRAKETHLESPYSEFQELLVAKDTDWVSLADQVQAQYADWLKKREKDLYTRSVYSTITLNDKQFEGLSKFFGVKR